MERKSDSLDDVERLVATLQTMKAYEPDEVPPSPAESRALRSSHGLFALAAALFLTAIAVQWSYEFPNFRATPSDALKPLVFAAIGAMICGVLASGLHVALGARSLKTQMISRAQARVRNDLAHVRALLGEKPDVLSSAALVLDQQGERNRTFIAYIVGSERLAAAAVVTGVIWLVRELSNGISDVVMARATIGMLLLYAAAFTCHAVVFMSRQREIAYQRGLLSLALTQVQSKPKSVAPRPRKLGRRRD